MARRREAAEEPIYHLRVKGCLDEKWADWFEGFVVTSREGGETLLSGAVVDQAELHGVLGRIRGLGLDLLLVARADCPCAAKNCPRRGHCRDCAAHHGARGELPYCFRARTRWDKRCAGFAAPR